MRLFFFFFILIAACGCSLKYRNAKIIPGSFPIPPDYSNIKYWAAHPWKKDPSDSIPLPLQNDINDSIADVFFIHPTTYTGTKRGWNGDLNDSLLNKKTDNTTILYQASVFNQHCRIFAPRYRQAHFSSFFTQAQEAQDAFDTAYSDIKKAFLYYLNNYNNNRPFIIAGHSQGAMLEERLLKEFFDTGQLKSKLIVAYITGWQIPKNYFNHLPVCRSDTETQCFCGWRTFRKGYIPSYIKSESSESYVTNPLSWKIDSIYMSRKANLGSILLNFNKIIPNSTDAQIYRGILWISKPKFPGSVFLRTKNYHIGDINIFYINMRSNIEKRIFTFKSR